MSDSGLNMFILYSISKKIVLSVSAPKSVKAAIAKISKNMSEDDSRRLENG